MAATALERDRRQRPAGSPQLDVSNGSDEGTRTTADRNLLRAKLHLQFQQMLRRLRAIELGEKCSKCSGRVAPLLVMPAKAGSQGSEAVAPVPLFKPGASSGPPLSRGVTINLGS